MTGVFFMRKCEFQVFTFTSPEQNEFGVSCSESVHSFFFFLTFLFGPRLTFVEFFSLGTLLFVHRMF